LTQKVGYESNARTSYLIMTFLSAESETQNSDFHKTAVYGNTITRAEKLG